MQQKALFWSLVVVLVAYCTLSAANIMLGGAKDAKIDSHTEEVANFAVTQLNGKANFPIQGSLKLGRIVSAKTQVVAGINHILHLETSDDSGKKEVEVTVYEKLPANVKANESPLELTKHKLVGPVAECHHRWARAAQQAVAQLSQRSNSLFPYQLVEVLSAEQNSFDNPDHQDLLVLVKRGDKHEKFSLTVKPSADDHYSLVKFAQKHDDVTHESGPATT
jgi:hypothetical protein